MGFKSSKILLKRLSTLGHFPQVSVSVSVCVCVCVCVCVGGGGGEEGRVGGG